MLNVQPSTPSTRSILTFMINRVKVLLFHVRAQRVSCRGELDGHHDGISRRALARELR